MHYRHSANCGLKISAVSIGGWINFGEGKVAEATAQKVVETAYAHQINFFDLADIYGKGEAEKQMGQALQAYPRHTLVISSKVFWPMSADVNDRGLSRKHIMESIEKSLNRLQTDYLDIYFCHRPDPETPIRETVQTMHDLVTQGKALYWGTSEWEAWQIAEAYELCERYGWHLPRFEQPQYSLLYRSRVEAQILPVTQGRGIGLVAWSPLAMGMLTGKYDAGIAPDTRFEREPWARDRYFNTANVKKVQRLKPIAEKLGITRGQLALAWCLRHPSMSSVITGATRPEQVIENVKAADIVLAPDVLAKIDKLFSEA